MCPEIQLKLLEKSRRFRRAGAAKVFVAIAKIRIQVRKENAMVVSFSVSF
jgi:hypothetical protein